MTDPVHVVCPSCQAINRLPRARLRDSGHCGKCKHVLLPAEPVTLTDATFARFIAKSDLPVIVDFWANWCGPCKMMAPAFAQAAGHLQGKVILAKVDTEQAPSTAGRYAIRSIPTLIRFERGQEVSRQAGAMGAADIVRWAQQ
ncbi:thioredoxin TrxC [Alteromonas sp. CYL-A6]|uniref:thioredoxin TrxC n=1 Tax=Alteromonas nitratireducens TaxID=3390813 RepID=UPI0034B276ED